VTFQVLDDDGTVVEEASDRFNVAVLQYTVCDDNDDGIFEPGDGIRVETVTVENNGGLTLPTGATLSLKDARESEDMFALAASADTSIAVPSMRVGESVVMAARGEPYEEAGLLRIQIPLPPTVSEAGPFIMPAQVCTEATMLQQSFHESMPATTISVQYPVQIERVVATTFAGPGATGQLRLTLRNISTRPYGNEASVVGTKRAANGGSWGSVEVAVTTDPLVNIVPQGDATFFLAATNWSEQMNQHRTHDAGGNLGPDKSLAPSSPSGSLTTVSSAWCYQPTSPNSCTVIVNRLGPGEAIEVVVNIHMRQEAGHDLFSSVPWSADVMLRGVPIERTAGKIRVVPLFNPNMYSDVCLITNKATDRDEFMAWSYIIQLLDLSMNIWDVERYGGLRNVKQRTQLDARGQAFDSFAGRCVTAIIPKLARSNAEEDENMDLDTISLEDSRRHFGYFGFGGDEGDIGTAPERSRLQALLSGLQNNTAEAIHLSDEAAEKAAMGVVTGIGQPGQGGCCDGSWCCSLVSLWCSSCYSICCGCCCCCGGDDDDVIEVDTNKAWIPTPISASDSAPTSNTMSANRFAYMSPFEARFAALYGPALASLEKNFRDDTGQRVGRGMLLLGWGREDTDKANLLFGARTASQITGTAKSGVEMLKMVRDLEGGQAVRVPWKPGFPCYEWPCIKSLHSTAISADVLAMRLQRHAQTADTMHRVMAEGDFDDYNYQDCCHDGNASYGHVVWNRNGKLIDGHVVWERIDGLAMHKAALPRDALLMAVDAFNGITDGDVSTDDVDLPYTLVRDAAGHATGYQAKTGHHVPLDSAFGKAFVSLLAVLPPRTLLSQLTDGEWALSVASV
jgi:hypothetical protein